MGELVVSKRIDCIHSLMLGGVHKTPAQAVVRGLHDTLRPLTTATLLPNCSGTQEKCAWVQRRTCVPALQGDPGRTLSLYDLQDRRLQASAFVMNAVTAGLKRESFPLTSQALCAALLAVQ